MVHDYLRYNITLPSYEIHIVMSRGTRNMGFGDGGSSTTPAGAMP